MKSKRSTSYDEYLDNLRVNPEYQKAERMISPYYEVALQIIRQRINLGLTQLDLAAKANTHQSRISKIESGEHDIRLSTLAKIAEALESRASIRLIPIKNTIYENEEPYTTLFNSALIPQTPTRYSPAETKSEIHFASDSSEDNQAWL